MTDDTSAHHEEGCLGIRGIMETQDSEQHLAHSEHPLGSESAYHCCTVLKSMLKNKNRGELTTGNKKRKESAKMAITGEARVAGSLFAQSHRR